eukprot:Pompholyxophrys_punicea_v1_NODE_629_length_1573_cov_3.821381.p3 type:complete len:123 gc:universal NODE_629_length_1573_cov_3.821381:404-36(-)
MCRSAVQVGSNRCGKKGFTVYDLLERGDMVMADRGFLIRTDLMLKGCSLSIPAFLDGRDQLSQTEVTEMRRIANLRIHIERAIGRVKRFRFLSAMHGHLAGTMNIACAVCTILSNFGDSLCT